MAFGRAHWVLVAFAACSKPAAPASPCFPGADREDFPALMATAMARLDDAGFLQGNETGDLLADERRFLRHLHLTVRAFGPSDHRVSQALGILATLYERHRRMDEYGVMRGRMLEAWAARQPRDAPPGPPPGGPWMAPGINDYDSQKQTPPTLLSRWMNRRVQPEIYSNTTSFERVAKKLEAELADAANKHDDLAEAAACDRLANTYAAHAEFGSARKYAARALELHRARLGPEHPETARTKAALDAIPDFDAP
jgi:hypothetical protein